MPKNLLSLLLLFTRAIDCMDVVEKAADSVIEAAQANLKKIGHEILHSPHSLTVLSAAILQQRWRHCSECMSYSEQVLQLQEEVRAPLNKPFVQPFAAELHSVFHANEPTKTGAMRSMPKVVADPKGEVLIAFSNTEFYIYGAWKGKPIAPLLHEYGTYIGCTWDFRHVVFFKGDTLSLFEVCSRTSFNTQITRQALESIEENEGQVEEGAGRANALEITRNGEALLHKNFMYERSAIDVDSYIFLHGSDENLVSPELGLFNGILYKELCFLGIMANPPIVPKYALPFHHPLYPFAIAEIFSRYLVRRQNCHNIRAMAATLDGRFLLIAGSCSGYNNYFENPLFRIDLTKLDSPQEMCKSTHHAAAGASHKVAISPDGLYALLFIGDHKTLPDYSEWFAKHPSVDERRRALNAFHDTKLVLINLETGGSFVVSENVPIIYFGFKDSGDHFYVWDGLDNFMTYSLDQATSHISATQISKLLTLRSARNTTLNDRGELGSERCKELIELLTAISPWAATDKDRRPLIETVIKYFSPAVSIEHFLEYFSGRV